MTNKDKLKTLTTGTCGFIFSNFIRKLVFESKNVYSISSIDKASTTNINSLYWNNNHKFYVADITDQNILETIFNFNPPDVVIHGAAESCVDKSLASANEFIKSNVLGTQNIINVCVKYGVKKLIYMSTDEVHGQLAEGDPAWLENAPLNPRNPYAASKASGELLVKAAHEAHGLNYNILRASNNYGPRQTTNKLIPNIIKCALEGNRIPIYGEGKQSREWTHVFDTCSAITHILENGQDNEIYNISSNQEFSNIEVAHMVCSILDKDYDIKCFNLIEFVKDPRGNSHDFRYSLNSTKLKTLGWSADIKFKEGLSNTIDWYMDNKWYLK